MTDVCLLLGNLLSPAHYVSNWIECIQQGLCLNDSPFLIFSFLYLMGFDFFVVLFFVLFLFWDALPLVKLGEITLLRLKKTVYRTLSETQKYISLNNMLSTCYPNAYFSADYHVDRQFARMNRTYRGVWIKNSMQPEKKCVSTEIIRLSFKLEIDFMCKIHQLLMYCRIRFFLLGILSCSEDIGCISTGNVYYMYHVTFTTIIDKLDQHGREFENIYI